MLIIIILMFSSNSPFMQCLPIRYLNQSLVIERNSLFHTITHPDCHNPSIESSSLFTVHLRAKNRFTEFQGWNPHRNIKRVTNFRRPTTFGRKYRTLLVTKEIFYSTAATAQSISQRPMTSAHEAWEIRLTISVTTARMKHIFLPLMVSQSILAVAAVADFIRT